MPDTKMGGVWSIHSRLLIVVASSGELWEWWHDPGVRLAFPVESASSRDTPGIISRPRRERIPPLELGGGNRAPLDMAGLWCFLSSGDGFVGELLELQQGCEGPFGSSRG